MIALVGISVRIKGEAVMLTMDEARELYAELGKLFGPRIATVRAPVNGAPLFPPAGPPPLITWTAPDTGQHPRPFGSDIVCEGDA